MQWKCNNSCVLLLLHRLKMCYHRVSVIWNDNQIMNEKQTLFDHSLITFQSFSDPLSDHISITSDLIKTGRSDLTNIINLMLIRYASIHNLSAHSIKDMCRKRPRIKGISENRAEKQLILYANLFLLLHKLGI